MLTPISCVQLFHNHKRILLQIFHPIISTLTMESISDISGIYFICGLTIVTNKSGYNLESSPSAAHLPQLGSPGLSFEEQC